MDLGVHGFPFVMDISTGTQVSASAYFGSGTEGEELSPSEAGLIRDEEGEVLYASYFGSVGSFAEDAPFESLKVTLGEASSCSPDKSLDLQGNADTACNAKVGEVTRCVALWDADSEHEVRVFMATESSLSFVVSAPSVLKPGEAHSLTQLEN